MDLMDCPVTTFYNERASNSGVEFAFGVWCDPLPAISLAAWQNGIHVDYDIRFVAK